MDEYNFHKSVTIINFNPGHVSFRNGITAELMEQLQGDLISLRLPVPDVLEIGQVLDSEFQCDSSGIKSCFSCLSMDLASKKQIDIGPPSMDFQGMKEDRSYIVVGGTKGLGLSTVEWMASRGKMA